MVKILVTFACLLAAHAPLATLGDDSSEIAPGQLNLFGKLVSRDSSDNDPQGFEVGSDDAKALTKEYEDWTAAFEAAKSDQLTAGSQDLTSATMAALTDLFVHGVKEDIERMKSNLSPRENFAWKNVWRNDENTESSEDTHNSNLRLTIQSDSLKNSPYSDLSQAERYTYFTLPYTASLLQPKEVTSLLLKIRKQMEHTTVISDKDYPELSIGTVSGADVFDHRIVPAILVTYREAEGVEKAENLAKLLDENRGNHPDLVNCEETPKYENFIRDIQQDSETRNLHKNEKRYGTRKWHPSQADLRRVKRCALKEEIELLVERHDKETGKQDLKNIERLRNWMKSKSRDILQMPSKKQMERIKSCAGIKNSVHMDMKDIMNDARKKALELYSEKQKSMDSWPESANDIRALVPEPPALCKLFEYDNLYSFTSDYGPVKLTLSMTKRDKCIRHVLTQAITRNTKPKDPSWLIHWNEHHNEHYSASDDSVPFNSHRPHYIAPGSYNAPSSSYRPYHSASGSGGSSAGYALLAAASLAEEITEYTKGHDSSTSNGVKDIVAFGEREVLLEICKRPAKASLSHWPVVTLSTMKDCFGFVIPLNTNAIYQLVDENYPDDEEEDPIVLFNHWLLDKGFRSHAVVRQIFGSRLYLALSFVQIDDVPPNWEVIGFTLQMNLRLHAVLLQDHLFGLGIAEYDTQVYRIEFSVGDNVDPLESVVDSIEITVRPSDLQLDCS
ncbi:hypothetical protein IWQ62_002110 [Dispira parvispora]|uniref:Uncharacterized protein n=1 Tax=Dispira parvispora TaxID=1520584 RepID=A0A9W8E469_9FUNG|nr:hypothetical protein IWQ62_002110 [Dispira parvispora]